MKLTIFAFEIAARYEPHGRLHQSLHRLVTTHPAQDTLQQKWYFYRQVTSELLVGLPLCERGCWDYFEDDARARKDYEMWVNGMVTEEGSRKEPSGDDPYRGGPRYMTFTMAFLMVHGSGVDLAMRNICQIPEPQLWHRATFQRILQGAFGVLNFASIQSDVAYLIPRDPGWGLTADDMVQPKFAYLRPIQ